jgi:serine/threonine protein kinase
VKEYPEFVSAQHGTASMWLKRELASPSMVELMAEPDRLLERSNCVIIKDQRKIKVGRVPLQWDGQKIVVYIKRYNAFSLRYRLQSMVACSGAQKSLRGAAILSAVGVPTARPVAAIEHHRGGLLLQSFYVSEEIADGKTVDAYWKEKLATLPARLGAQRRRRFLQELAGLFSRLHDRDVYHNDLKDANILIAPRSGAPEESFFLLDLEGVRRGARLSRSRRVKNLVQLNRTLGKHLKPSERWYFLTCYLSAQGIDRQTKKRWAADIHRQSVGLDKIKSIDHES